LRLSCSCDAAPLAWLSPIIAILCFTLIFFNHALDQRHFVAGKSEDGG
jgi:hypothetical protein